MQEKKPPQPKPKRIKPLMLKKTPLLSLKNNQPVQPKRFSYLYDLFYRLILAQGLAYIYLAIIFPIFSLNLLKYWPQQIILSACIFVGYSFIYRFWRIILPLFLIASILFIPLSLYNFETYSGLIVTVQDYINNLYAAFIYNKNTIPIALNHELGIALFFSATVQVIVILFSLMAKRIYPWKLLVLYTVVVYYGMNQPVGYLFVLTCLALLIITLLFTKERRQIINPKQKTDAQKLSLLNYFKQPKLYVFQRPSILLCTLVVIMMLIVHSFLPQHFFQNKKLNLYTDKFLELLDFKDKKIHYFDFDLFTYGYKPLYSKLGGPLYLEEKPVFYISKNDTPLYLRGNVSREYDGENFHHLSMDPNWRYYNGENSKPFIEAYLGIKSPSYTNQLQTLSYVIEPIQTNMQVILLNGMPEEITPKDNSSLHLYYNKSGIVYNSVLLENLAYEVKAQYHPVINQFNSIPDLDLENQNALTANEISYEQDIFQNYLQLPNINAYAENGEVIRLAKNITKNWKDKATASNAENHYKKACLIAQYLSQNYVYDLNPPEFNSLKPYDFVRNFLESKSGYCVHFAASLTMLCRSLGIPARYVEGFSVPPQKINSFQDPADDLILITNKRAHAWTEIYLSGYGWVPMDATPGSAIGMEEEIIVEETDETDETEDSSEATDPLEPTEITPTTLEPTLPTSKATSQIKAQQYPDAKPVKTFPYQLILIILGILGFVLIITLYYFHRKNIYQRRHNLDWLKNHYPDSKQLILLIYQDLKQLYHLFKIEATAGMTVASYLAKSPIDFTNNENVATQRALMESIKLIEEALYAAKLAPEQNIEPLIAYHLALETLYKTKSSTIKWLMTRFLFSKKAKPF